jgi:tRNA pseudouridine38/39 synthase
MREGSQYLIGVHDFRGFCKFSPDDTSHCVRRIDRIEFDEVENDVWYFEIVGSGFIWHQIRCIATVLFFIGEGLEEPSIVSELLDISKFPGRPQYAIADPEPLVFWRAEYEDVEWQGIGDELGEKLRANFGAMLADLETRVAVLRCFTGGPPPEPRQGVHRKIAELPTARPVEEVWEEYQRERQGAEPDEGDE